MKKIVIALVIILILGVVIAIVAINKHTEQEGPNVIIDIANNNDNFNEENAYVKRVTLTAEESYLYDSEDWISGDSSNLSTYLKNIDYSKIARKDESKELVYEKTYKYGWNIDGAKQYDCIEIKRALEIVKSCINDNAVAIQLA